MLACVLCHRPLVVDISCETIPHIKCEVCADLFCLNCFSQDHDRHHAYSVGRDRSLLPSCVAPEGGWMERQDLALLAGVEKLGFGNWEDISSIALRGAHPPEACQARFLLLRQVLLPDEDIPSFPLQDVAKINLQSRVRAASLPPGAHLAGYCALRQDFDVVFMNDAEILLADMSFEEEKDEVERARKEEWHALKLKVLRNYNLKIDEREYRKSLALGRGLLDFTRQQDIRKRMNQTMDDMLLGELDFIAKFGPSWDEFAAFRENIAMERKLRMELTELHKYAALGVTSVREMERMRDVKRIHIEGPSSSSSSSVTAPPLLVGEEDRARLNQWLGSQCDAALLQLPRRGRVMVGGTKSPNDNSLDLFFSVSD